MNILTKEEDYTEWRYLWPPRPERAVPKAMIPFFQRQGWSANVKKNGTCSIIGRCDDKVIRSATRHDEPHKAWQADYNSPALRALKRLPNQWFVFEAEVLHSKGNGLRDFVCIFDILVANNKTCDGMTWSQRMSLLYQLFPEAKESRVFTGLDMIDERLSIIRPLINVDFLEVFESLTNGEDEGLVLKDPNSVLAPCYHPSSNADWQIKCRKPTKNYGH